MGHHRELPLFWALKGKRIYCAIDSCCLGSQSSAVPRFDCYQNKEKMLNLTASLASIVKYHVQPISLR